MQVAFWSELLSLTASPSTCTCAVLELLALSPAVWTCPEALFWNLQGLGRLPAAAPGCEDRFSLWGRAGGGWCRFGAGQLFPHAGNEEGVQRSRCPCSGVAHLVLLLASASSSATHPCCRWPVVPRWGCEGTGLFLAQVGISFLLGALCFPVDLEPCPALAEVQAHLVIPQGQGLWCLCLLLAAKLCQWVLGILVLSGRTMCRVSHGCLGLPRCSPAQQEPKVSLPGEPVCAATSVSGFPNRLSLFLFLWVTPVQPSVGCGNVPGAGAASPLRVSWAGLLHRITE